MIHNYCLWTTVKKYVFYGIAFILIILICSCSIEELNQNEFDPNFFYKRILDIILLIFVRFV